MPRYPNPTMLCALGVIVMCSSAWGQMYKWVDANGQTQYSDKPPATADKSKATVLQAPPSPAAASKATDWQAKDLEFRKRQVDRAEAKRREDDEARAKKENAESQRQGCLEARDDVNNLQGGVRIFHWNAQGEKVYMDDSERPVALAKAQQNVAQRCN
jgi:hypothetical protein